MDERDGREAVRGPGAGFTVRSGSAIRFHDDAVPATNKLNRVSDFCYLLFAASGESLTIDDGVFSTRELYATDPADGAGQSFRIRGPGGQLRVTGGVFGDLGHFQAADGAAAFPVVLVDAVHDHAPDAQHV